CGRSGRGGPPAEVGGDVRAEQRSHEAPGSLRFPDPVLRSEVRPRLVPHQTPDRGRVVFNPAAVSPAGARGLAQWMPASWREWDDEDGIPALDDPHNPEEAIEAMCKYMAFLYGRF